MAGMERKTGRRERIDRRRGLTGGCKVMGRRIRRDWKGGNAGFTGISGVGGGEETERGRKGRRDRNIRKVRRSMS